MRAGAAPAMIGVHVERAGQGAGRSPEVNRAGERTWQQLRAGLAGLAPGGASSIAERSGFKTAGPLVGPAPTV